MNRNVGATSYPWTQGYTPITDPVIDVGAGMWHTCVVTYKGRVMCWGVEQVSGAMGYAATNFAIGGLTTAKTDSKGYVDTGVCAKAIKARYVNTAIITTNDKILVWGDNLFGTCATGEHINHIGDDDYPCLTSEKTLGGSPVAAFAMGGMGHKARGSHHRIGIRVLLGQQRPGAAGCR